MVEAEIRAANCSGWRIICIPAPMLRDAMGGPHKPRPATATDKAGGVDRIRLVRRRDLTRAF